MVDKRQTRNEERHVPAEDSVAAADSEETVLRELPGGLAPLKTIHDELATELLELAEQQVAEVRRKLGSQATKPKLKRVEELFSTQAGKAPRVTEEIERLIRGAGLVKQTATLDGTFDRALASAFNAYDASSVAAGSSVQSAHDKWNMAVRFYKSDLRAAGATLRAEIDAARRPAAPAGSDVPAKGGAQVQYYTKSATIGASLVDYEKDMQKAGADLATAFAQLISALYGAVDSLAVAEATLIAATQNAYKTYWTGIQNAMDQTRA